MSRSEAHKNVFWVRSELYDICYKLYFWTCLTAFCVKKQRTLHRYNEF